MKKTLIAGIPIRFYYENKKEIIGIYNRYLDYLENYGFIVVFLTKQNLNYFINKIDCLVLIGGGDVNPHLYNKIDNFINYDSRLDNLEYLAINKALKIHKPILGICRGLQILNVYFSGTLKEVPNTHQGLHVIIKNNNDKKVTNSFHHQCIDELAENFTLISKTNDDVVEEIEDKKRMIYAVQYHPEINNDLTVLDYFKTYFKL
ncbi:MAG: gamma-glutamyl-gamma-aminobutyrate hydrolase family protein [Erysipelotrichales bacterium]|nr:gamma-glutamyl-gamma-aminobutyrate hydrolase family protein [Erysipelotrichales bacterium]